MERANRSAQVIRFEAFEFDLRAEELRKNGMKLRLRGQPFQVLAMLLERLGEIVTREELQQRLWPEGTFVDFDHSLNTAVNKIREVLGDSAENPRFVETLARRGYRFIAPVEEVGRTVPPEKASTGIGVSAASKTQAIIPDKQKGGEQSPTGRKVTGLIWLAVLSALILGASWIYFRHLIPKPPTLPPMQVSRFTSYPGKEKDPALSPDGKQIAFAWDGEKRDNFDIYVQLIGGEKPLPLTSDPRPDLSPSWSPDGRYIAFARVSEGNAFIYLVPSWGGHERKLADMYSIWSEGKSLDWSPDGKSLAVSGKNSPDEPQGLFLISVETGDKQRLTSSPMQFGIDGYPAFSPDGQTLAFTRIVAYSDIYVLSLGGRQLTRLTSDTASHASAWSSDGREVIFLKVTWISNNLSKVPISGGEPEFLGISTSGDHQSISRQGNRLAFVEQIYDTGIWQIEVPTYQSKRSPPIHLISSSQWDDNPQYSPDGKRIAFGSSRSGSYETWICDSDGRNPRQLTSFPEATVSGSARWSPNGRSITFGSFAKGVSNIFVISAEGGSPRRLTDENGDGFLSSWSSDGHWIYFCSKRSGEYQIWKMPVEGGKAVQVTKKGGFEPVEAPDGKTLFYSKLDSIDPTSGSARLWKIPVQGGEETLALDRTIYPRYWAITDQGIYFVRSDWSRGPNIEFFSLATGRVTQIVALEKLPVGKAHPGLTVSPDGRWILCALLERDTSDIMLVENFH